MNSPRVSLEKAPHGVAYSLAPLGGPAQRLTPEFVVDSNCSRWRLRLVRHDLPLSLVGGFAGAALPQFQVPPARRGVHRTVTEYGGHGVGAARTARHAAYLISDYLHVAHVDDGTGCPYTCQYTCREVAA